MTHLMLRYCPLVCGYCSPLAPEDRFENTNGNSQDDEGISLWEGKSGSYLIVTIAVIAFLLIIVALSRRKKRALEEDCERLAKVRETLKAPPQQQNTESGDNSFADLITQFISLRKQTEHGSIGLDGDSSESGKFDRFLEFEWDEMSQKLPSGEQDPLSSDGQVRPDQSASDHIAQWSDYSTVPVAERLHRNRGRQFSSMMALPVVTDETKNDTYAATYSEMWDDLRQDANLQILPDTVHDLLDHTDAFEDQYDRAGSTRPMPQSVSDEGSYASALSRPCFRLVDVSDNGSEYADEDGDDESNIYETIKTLEDKDNSRIIHKSSLEGAGSSVGSSVSGHSC
jgi:hypothetical protein